MLACECTLKCHETAHLRKSVHTTVLKKKKARGSKHNSLCSIHSKRSHGVMNNDETAPSHWLKSHNLINNYETITMMYSKRHIPDIDYIILINFDTSFVFLKK